MSQTIAPAAIRRTLTLRSTPEAAFRAFTDGIDRWWPRTHSVGDAPLKKATIESRVGGRWFGLTEDGVEHDWGDVLAWEPPRRLLLAWRLDAQFAYDPALLTEVEVRFTAFGDGETRVDFEHRGLENLGASAQADQTRSGMDQGWGVILKSYETAVGA